MFSLFVKTESANENGKHYINYFIVAQDNNGRRLQLKTSQINNLFITDRDAREIQNKRIISIEHKLSNGNPMNPDHWIEIEPAKDSKAWNYLQQISN